MSSPTNTLTGLPVTDEQLKSLSSLAEQMVKAEQQVERLQKALDDATTSLNKLSMSLIPDLMTELGMESFSLSNGYSVEVKKFYNASIAEEKQDEAFTWLRNNDFDAIIKRVITSSFGKGEDKKAEKLKTTLLKQGFPFIDKSSIHASTLKAFVRERIEAGDGTFPKDLFGVFEGKKTKITPPKQ